MPRRSPAALMAALLLLALGIAPAFAAQFTDAAGRRVELPDNISRIMPADRDAEVLMYVLAPDKLVGLERGAGRRGPPGRPALAWRRRSVPQSMAETARLLRPQVIVDASPVTLENAVYADQVQQLTGIPYILVDDSFARTPRVLRSFGRLLSIRERADDLALFAEHAIAAMRGRLLIQSPEQRPRVYFARGYDGLSTALPGSPAGATIDEAGAINVAYPMGRGGEVRVNPAQLFAWDPTIILTEERGVYNAFLHDPSWRGLSAVRQHRVYLVPSLAFGWIEDPSGVNRLIGLYWLSGLLYPDATQEDLRTTVCDFYDKFYRIQLTNGQLEAMLRPAGVAPAQLSQSVGAPLLGLGAAPPSSLPMGTPGAVQGGGTPRRPAARPGTGADTGANAAPAGPLGGLGGMGAMTMGGPRQSCVVPRGPSPVPLDQLPGLMNNPSTSPLGVPPPGRRGRPAALLGPTAPALDPTAGSPAQSASAGNDASAHDATSFGSTGLALSPAAQAAVVNALAAAKAQSAAGGGATVQPAAMIMPPPAAAAPLALSLKPSAEPQSANMASGSANPPDNALPPLRLIAPAQPSP